MYGSFKTHIRQICVCNYLAHTSQYLWCSLCPRRFLYDPFTSNVRFAIVWCTRPQKAIYPLRLFLFTTIVLLLNHHEILIIIRLVIYTYLRMIPSCLEPGLWYHIISSHRWSNSIFKWRKCLQWQYRMICTLLGALSIDLVYTLDS